MKKNGGKHTWFSQSPQLLIFTTAVEQNWGELKRNCYQQRHSGRFSLRARLAWNGWHTPRLDPEVSLFFKATHLHSYAYGKGHVCAQPLGLSTHKMSWTSRELAFSPVKQSFFKKKGVDPQIEVCLPAFAGQRGTQCGVFDEQAVGSKSGRKGGGSTLGTKTHI